MDMGLWVSRLEATANDLVFVGMAADLAKAKQELRQAPAGFVIPGSERAEANELMNDVSQTVRADVGIVLAIRHAGSVNGSAHVDALNTLRAQVRAGVLGWVPDDANEQTEFVDGRLLGFDKRVLWWMDTYRTEYTIESQ